MAARTRTCSSRGSSSAIVTARVLRALLWGVSVKIATAVGLNTAIAGSPAGLGGAVDPVDQLPVRLHDGVGFAATADHVEACSTCP